MSGNTNEELRSIAVSSLSKCVEKLSRVSAGTWSIAGADVSIGTLDDAIRRHAADDGDSTAVYFDVKGELPFVAIILFDPRDIASISKCLLGYAFSGSPALTQAGELLLSELGNILLNSFVSALSNALKRIFIPSAPRCLRGEPRYLLEAMGVAMDVKQSYRILSVRLDIRCDTSVTRSEVLGLIPEKLAQELLKVDNKEAV
jgi:chemotaxis protein CheY-P-specific phosphatase CheC